MSAPGAEIAVVHLVRAANGPAPFRRFLASYDAHPAGRAHELVLLFKGFHSPQATAEYRALAGERCSAQVDVSDDGFDVDAYLAAVHRLEHRRVCLLNSFSVIQADRWLDLLASAAEASGAGLVGTTGSWGSQVSHVRYTRGWGGPYAHIQRDPAVTRRLFETLIDGANEPSDPPPRHGSWITNKLTGAGALLRLWAGFDPFPAPHLRTNGFLAATDILRRVRAGRPRDKLQAYRLESGRHSVTRQVAAMGLSAVVAGRDGRCYGERDWPRSHTFWQGNQENLLIADNQTASYQDGDLELRDALSRFAWGNDADPARPTGNGRT